MSQVHRKKRQNRRRGGAGRVALLTVAVTLIGTAIAALALVGYVVGIAASAPSLDSLKPINRGTLSIVYAADGKRLGFIQSDELRTPIPAQDIPQSLKDATVAIEDQRFYRHKGVDFEGVIRAAIKNLRSGKTVQGGSTITMQLVRNLYISNEGRTFKRKVREAKLAEELENEHPGRAGKSWILAKYLNTVPYGTVGGQNAVGVQAAARIFFNTTAGRLTLPQSALIAGLPQQPSVFNPFQNPKGALHRRNEVLRKMADLGYVQPETAQRAIASPLGVVHSRYYTERRESYFFDYVTQQLIDRYGINRVRKGGLRIHTTIDLGKQKAARAAMTGQLNQPGDPASAIVSIDPRNGYIRAMASSASYAQSKFNVAAQGHRQAGSTFKVMVLMTALRRGVDPNRTSYVSKHLAAGWLKTAPTYEVQTYGHSYSGRMNLVSATLKSDNTVYAQLDADLGPESVKQTAYDMGIKTHLDGYPAEGLGGLTIGVSPLEMANAYATIASGGWRNKPIAVTRVVFPDGRSEYLGTPNRTKAFEDGVTYEATQILEKNIQGGTGTAANIGCPAAGKTGTVDDFTDAWFDGFTPHLTTAVWVGYPNAKVPMTSVHGIQVNGGSFPARIWHDYMAVAKGSDCSDFPQPSTPFVSAPFFGKFATTGAPDDKFSKDYNQKQKDKKDSTGGNGGSKYNPNFYEAPPQPPPTKKGQTTTPGTTTSPGTTGGTGTGGQGTGNGKGKGGDGGTG
ncbi:MAG: penicillin-binding protein [Solirubrobacteraceae bacterium]|nr:penicillin-binding protein [Solirubrobacteraceae bacterium]